MHGPFITFYLTKKMKAKQKTLQHSCHDITLQKDIIFAWKC